mmetsp:Transcript_94493/g.273158  ORF Transcript_94493/g.273158 Transcript_94493/m.273158 type:complete len:299 (-) Transcript_94493:378-1274(-)
MAMAGRFAARIAPPTALTVRKREHYISEKPRLHRLAVACVAPSAHLLRGQEYFGHTLDKTRLCKYFEQGKCTHGCSCTFAHGVAELQSQPNFQRSQLCVEFSHRGACRYGVGCRFAHGVEQLREHGRRVQQTPATPASPCPAPEERPTTTEQRRLEKELQAMRKQTRALQAKLAALEHSGDSSLASPPATMQCEGLARLSSVSTEDGSVDSGGEGVKAMVAVPARGVGAPDMQSLRCDASLLPEPKMDALLVAPAFVVKNTFVEVEEVQRAAAPPPRRAHSAPDLCGEACAVSGPAAR